MLTLFFWYYKHSVKLKEKNTPNKTIKLPHNFHHHAIVVFSLILSLRITFQMTYISHSQHSSSQKPILKRAQYMWQLNRPVMRVRRDNESFNIIKLKLSIDNSETAISITKCVALSLESITRTWKNVNSCLHSGAEQLTHCKTTRGSTTRLHSILLSQNIIILEQNNFGCFFADYEQCGC